MKYSIILFLTISLLSLTNCQVEKGNPLKSANIQSEKKSDNILIIEKAGPIFGKTFAEYKKLQAEWDYHKRIGESSQFKFLKDNESWFIECGVSLKTIENGVAFFEENEDAVKEAIGIRAKTKAAGELASERYSKMFIEDEKSRLSDQQ